MSEDATSQSSIPLGTTAGQLLRRARQAQGLHIAALAASIKVAPRKLELLEADRLEELPDVTFTRALAQTVCRTLKIDAAPVLALLPRPAGARLDQVGEGLNAPFREHPGRIDPSGWEVLMRPAVWGSILVLLAAAAIYFAPVSLPSWARWGWSATPANEPSPAASQPASANPAAAVRDLAPAPASTVVETVTTAPPAPAVVVASSDVAAPVASGVLQLRTTAESWVEVLDARSQPLLSRMVQPGETVGVDGARPFRVRIGNASVTQVIYRGQTVELAGHTRDNVAKLELK